MDKKNIFQKIHQVQQAWANGIIEIGKLKNQREKCELYANDFLSRFYGFESGPVLFKPTKASIKQFRNDKRGALSYFIGGDPEYPEDKGFALKPWIKICFENAGIIIEKERVIAMGNYFFTDEHGNEIKVEYTFGYRLNNESLIIDLHHSSIPYTPQHI